MSQRDRSCPDFVTIAAFVNGTLDEETTRSVTAHIADCDECVVAISEVGDFARQEAKVVQIAEKARFWKALAVAAGLVIVIGTVAAALRRPIDHWLYLTSIRTMTKAAPAAERRIEARLTGGFGWSRLHDPGRGASSVDPALVLIRVAANNVLQKTAGKDSARQRHAAGVATLLLERDDEAIRSLAAAAQSSPRDASLWSDLSAAYLDSAVRHRRPAELQPALDASDAALRLDRNLPEALFNRALVLERMERNDEAAAAWRRYLEVDRGKGGWADEARAHLASLKR